MHMCICAQILDHRFRCSPVYIHYMYMYILYMCIYILYMYACARMYVHMYIYILYIYVCKHMYIHITHVYMLHGFKLLY
jgi:hypothetical protein